MADVTDKMALIQSIFIDSKEKALSIPHLNELNESLLLADEEFLSIAYEAAAMGIAIKSIENNNSLIDWINFYEKYGKNHAAQVHVGLGWAISELNLGVNAYLKDLDPLLKYRVIDGYAYYEGKFKRRQSVRMQQIPENFDDLNTKAYNQGLGRSFWYIAQGEPEKLARLITIFPMERQYDMWRGVGVAVAYVGGISKNSLLELISLAEKNLTAFKCGIAIAAQTREKANAYSKDTDMICNTILNMSSTEISQQLTQLENTDDLTVKSIYFDWITNIEKQL